MPITKKVEAIQKENWMNECKKVIKTTIKLNLQHVWEYPHLKNTEAALHSYLSQSPWKKGTCLFKKFYEYQMPKWNFLLAIKGLNCVSSFLTNKDNFSVELNHHKNNIYILKSTTKKPHSCLKNHHKKSHISKATIKTHFYQNFHILTCQCRQKHEGLE